ncbi:MAG: MFS transporter [Candidatus Pacebacteria bacterium]|nr:MFS transporter [Candidatus Paceibacterota bacterium]
MKHKKEILIILLIQITEVLGFSLILPFLPFMAQDFGATPFLVGLILTSFSLLQFITAPIMGRLSDRFGRRPLLIVSQVSTAAGFLILGFAKSLPMLFLSRIVDGAIGSNFTIGQAVLSDLSTKKERSRIFGIGGIAFGFGFLVGPVLGGALAKSSYSLPAFLAAGISLVTILMTLFFLPETSAKKKLQKNRLKIVDWSSIKAFLITFPTGLILAQLFFYLWAQAIFQGSFSLFARKQLNLGTDKIGYLLGYVGLINIFIRGWLLGKLINFLSEEKLRFWGMILLAVGLFLFPLARNFKNLLLSMTFFALGNSLARPFLTGAISRSVSDSKQGEVMGVVSSLGSLARIFGPISGGVILTSLPVFWLGIGGGGLMIIALFFYLREKHALKFQS